MNHSPSAIERFFHAFEKNTASGDIAAQTAQFADMFLAANPAGSQAVCNSDFALALPKRKRLFDKLGCTSTTLESLRETALDARYVLADTEWRMTFDLPGGSREEVIAGSVFIVDTGGDPFKILFYLAKLDIFAVLRARGILRD
jgi:hypothetical protein